MVNRPDISLNLTIFLGWRIGKGEGFADLEYAMMASMGAVDENTVIVTTVHDCQVRMIYTFKRGMHLRQMHACPSNK